MGLGGKASTPRAGAINFHEYPGNSGGLRRRQALADIRPEEHAWCSVLRGQKLAVKKRPIIDVGACT